MGSVILAAALLADMHLFRLAAEWCRAPRNEEEMSMDRLNRAVAGGLLVAVVGTVAFSGGCRSMRNDVPPGKPYSTTGATPPTVGFSSDPRSNAAIGGGMYPNALSPGSPSSTGNPALSGAGGAPQYGTPGPNPSPYGAPTSNVYGAPATNPGTNP
jgi:hypothetical protein